MNQKTEAGKTERLSQPLILRVNPTTFKRLEKIQKNSNCQSIGEVARKILSRERILCFHKDISMDAIMEELAGIRKELKSIGININQQTRNFHTANNDAQRNYYFLKTTDLYKSVGIKVESLLNLIAKLSEKWLQK